jgi:hypothetical protein
MIVEAGVYNEISPSDYFADCAPMPSLTQSIIKVLLEKSPLHAWHAHPRLNPDYRHNDDRKFDIGNIAHALLIGRGKSIVVLEGFDDWRKKAAQEARDDAAATGKIAVLGKHFALASRMVEAARDQLAVRGLHRLFRDGHGEVVTVWNEGPIWCRQMIDWLTPDLIDFADYKTTLENAAPHAIGRKMVNDGWHLQAGWAERGLDNLNPSGAGRRRFFFVCQEVEKPYALTVVRIGEAPLTMARKQIDYAVTQWRWSMAENFWPSYPTEVITPEYPGWAEQQWLTREVSEEAQECARKNAEKYGEQVKRSVEARSKMLTDLSGG